MLGSSASGRALVGDPFFYCLAEARGGPVTNDDLQKHIHRKEVVIPEHPPTPVIVVDTREQKPFKFSIPTVKRGLASGDYSIVGYENDITVERKSLPDLVRCCGRDRQRFMEQCRRLTHIKHSVLVVEAGWAEIEAGQWRSNLSSECVIGTLCAVAGMGVPFITADTRKRAALLTQRFLLGCHKREWAYLRRKFIGR